MPQCLVYTQIWLVVSGKYTQVTLQVSKILKLLWKIISVSTVASILAIWLSYRSISAKWQHTFYGEQGSAFALLEEGKELHSYNLVDASASKLKKHPCCLTLLRCNTWDANPPLKCKSWNLVIWGTISAENLQNELHMYFSRYSMEV
jgi:hypothetical protein